MAFQRPLPASLAEYIGLVRQALDEVQDFRDAIDESDLEEEAERWVPVAEQIEAGLRRLLDDLTAGRHRFEDADLPFMPLVARWRRGIPFASLLELVNQAHRRGI